MKTFYSLIILCALALPLNTSIAQISRDTTFIVDLNSDGVNETLTFHFTGDTTQYGFVFNPEFTLSSGSVVLNDKADMLEGTDIKIIDIDKNDNFKEIVLSVIGVSDMNEYFIYRYDGELKQIGKLSYMNDLQPAGDGTMKGTKWMGFWMMAESYKYNSNTKLVEFVPEEFYNVDQQATVKTRFNILKDRQDNIEGAISVAPRTKITIIKADLLPKCKNMNGDDDDFFCDWYMVRTEDGKEGWIRLRELQESVEGLNWAG